MNIDGRQLRKARSAIALARAELAAEKPRLEMAKSWLAGAAAILDEHISQAPPSDTTPTGTRWRRAAPGEQAHFFPLSTAGQPICGKPFEELPPLARGKMGRCLKCLAFIKVAAERARRAKLRENRDRE